MKPTYFIWSLMSVLCLMFLLACGKDSGRDAAAKEGGAGSLEGDASSRDEGDDRDAASPGSGEGGAASTVTLTQLYGSATPVFLMAYDRQGVGIGFLSIKDEAGNPVRVTGIAIFDQTEVFRIEVDEEGRPVTLATPDELVRLTDYAASSATLTYEHRDGTSRVEAVTFDPEELESAKVVPPNLDFVEKSADASLMQELLSFGAGLLELTRCSVEGVLGESRLSAKKLFGETLICFAGDTNPASRDQLVQILAAVDFALDAGLCAVGVGGLAALLLSGAGSVVAASMVAGQSALGLLVGCQSVIQTLTETPKGLDVDQVYVDGAPWFGDPEIAPKLIRASLHPARNVIQLGDSVLITAVVDGGMPPYETGWAKNAELVPEWDNLVGIEDAPEERTWYEFAVQDTSRSYDVFDVAGAWVAVCGDGECSPEEDRVSCPAECDNEPAPIEESPDAPARVQGTTLGDPHLLTFDKLAYDFQAVGEFVLVRSDDAEVEVQVRTAPFGPSVAVNVGVAMKLGDDVLEFSSEEWQLNGEPTPLAEIELGAGTVTSSGAQTTIDWDGGARVTVESYSRWLWVTVFVPDSLRGVVVGLLGDADGDNQNDLTLADGEPLETPVPFEVLYGEFADAWRVTDETSLFTYREGKTSEDYTDRSFPGRHSEADSLNADARAAAETTCRARGVSDPIWLDACVLDLVLTGDETFADGFVGAPAPEAALEVVPPPDEDGDFIADGFDNCLGLKNTSQSDLDRDGIGDACDTDLDGDVIANEADVCPTVPDPDQDDTNGDGVGDACEDPPAPVGEGRASIVLEVGSGGTVLVAGETTCPERASCLVELDEAWAFSAEASLSVVAQPSVGFTFAGWGGDCSGTEPQFLLEDQMHFACSAHFQPLGTCEVDLAAASVATTIPTVVVLEFGSGNSLASLESAVVEFGTDGAFQFATRIDVTSTPPRAMLAGASPESSVQYRVRLTEPEACFGATGAITTGALPIGAPSDATVTAGSSTTPPTRGLILTGMYTGAWALMLNELGQVVWAYATPAAQVSRALLDPRGTHVYARDLNAQGASGGTLYHIAVDGSTVESFALDRSHHDFAIGPTGDIYYLSKVGSAADGVPCDAVRRLSADGSADELVFDLWTVLEDAARDAVSTENCHANSLRYEPTTNTLTVGEAFSDTIINVTLDGEVIWLLGGTLSAFTSDVSWDRQYGHQMIGDSRILLFDNGPVSPLGPSQVFELELNPAAGTANATWSYESGLISQVLGDVQRLPAGNTLVTYSTGSAIQELDPNGTLIQTMTLPYAIGYAQHVGKLD